MPTSIIRIHAKLRRFLADQDDIYLIQSVEGQTLSVCRSGILLKQYKASTSRFGIGIRENSFKTPPGVHRIKEKIGAGAPLGRIFRDRIDTGLDWDGSPDGDNLILTRILRLEGLEKGINTGPSVDSYDRYIYIHGTNKEDLVGAPLSHGCVVLTNLDMLDLFDAVKEGVLLYIDPPPIVVGDTFCRNVHFTGIFGTGMSALAQYLRFCGIGVSGSDRLLESKDTVSIRQSLEALGCLITAQDGSGVTDETDAVCISTAIEESNPDIAAARAQCIPIFHRSDLLAAIIDSKRAIAVAGTSGKSTVTAMIFEFLTACGQSPSLISGAPLRRLEREGLIGNAWSGASDLLVVEADESDGTLIKYSPKAAVILNISRDHKTIEEIGGLFLTLLSRSSWTAVNADDPILVSFPSITCFGLHDGASWRPDNKVILPYSVALFRKGIKYHLPLPGNHNLENLCAALCVCEYFNCNETALSEAVLNFEGVARRFSVTRTKQGVIVVDDYAHNPVKIAAAVDAAHALSERVIAVYQPHGFGPTRFLMNQYITTFRTIFRQDDSLYLLPIYYAGGTAQKDISSEDIINGIGAAPFSTYAAKDRDDLLERLRWDVKPGDCILVMGARDPSLPALVLQIEGLFGGKE